MLGKRIQPYSSVVGSDHKLYHGFLRQNLQDATRESEIHPEHVEFRLQLPQILEDQLQDEHCDFSRPANSTHESWMTGARSHRSPPWLDFFFHTLFSAESHAGPPKNIKDRKMVFIVARHQICTVHEKSKNQSHRLGSRLGMVESGIGSVRSWPRGGRAPSPLVAPSVGMESSDDAKACMPAWVKMADNREMRGVT